MWSTRYSCQILMKRVFSRQISENYSKIKFRENSSSGSRVVPSGRTDGQRWRKLLVAFRKFENAPTTLNTNYRTCLKCVRVGSPHLQKWGVHWRLHLKLVDVLNSWSWWPRGLRRGPAAACMLGLRVRIPAGHGGVYLVSVVCRQRSVRRAYHSSRVVLPSVVCLSVIVKPRQWGGPVLLGAVYP
jgi:hypothetical protein